jgi:hypothetical protein
MQAIRPFLILFWIALPSVMFGGFSLLNLITRDALTPFQEQFFRAGHAHAGVLLILALAYAYFLGLTTLADRWKVLGCALLTAGILAQSGGFFLHMLIGAPGTLSAGNVLTMAGAVTLVVAMGLLVYALVRHWSPTPQR